MPLIPPLQCLFCKHLNPSGASFCNNCGSQLNLQPCGQCGAIDDRAAKHCYKCGADFSLPAAAGLEAPFASAVPESNLSFPALNLTNVALQQLAHGVDETASTDDAASTPRPQRRLRLALPASLIALFAVSVYFYSRPSAQLEPKQYLPPAAQAASAAPMPAGPSPGPVAESEAKSRQDSAVVEDCPPAVATLGLCSPAPQQEGR